MQIQDLIHKGFKDMLILNRYAGQSITIYLEDGREIDIKVLDIIGKNNKFAKIGIDAAKSIKIIRDELITQEMQDDISVLSVLSG
jgi:carbon storage regulator CsrA